MPGIFERLSALLAGPGHQPSLSRPVSDLAPQSPKMAADDARLPDACRPIVAQLLALAADIEARGAQDPLLASAIIEIRQMRDHHLPQLVASYADIPAAHRAEIFRTTGHSASYNLNQSLARMLAKAQALSRQLAQEDINSFEDNLRFINQRYGGVDPLP